MPTRWTLAERTAIQSLLNQDLPLEIVMRIMAKNRDGIAVGKWRIIKQVIGMLNICAWMYPTKYQRRRQLRKYLYHVRHFEPLFYVSD